MLNRDERLLQEVLLVDAFRTGEFSDELIAWMKEKPASFFMEFIPHNMTTLRIPCIQFDKQLGKAKLIEMREAMPDHVRELKLDSLFTDDNGQQKVYFWQLKKVLEALAFNTNITSIDVSGNRIFTIPMDKFVLIFSKGFPNQVTDLNFSGSMPVDTGITSEMVVSRLKALRPHVKNLDLSRNNFGQFSASENDAIWDAVKNKKTDFSANNFAEKKAPGSPSNVINASTFFKLQDESKKRKQPDMPQAAAKIESERKRRKPL